jgi:hypothetical protein
MARWMTLLLIVLLSCIAGCGDDSDADERGCPNEQVNDTTPCDSADAGLECPGAGSDDLCWDWTCSCSESGTFECFPGTCA